MKDCKMIYTCVALDKLEELGIRLLIKKTKKVPNSYLQIVAPAVIYVKDNTYQISNYLSGIVSSELPFLEERDLLAMKNPLKLGSWAIKQDTVNRIMIRSVNREDREALEASEYSPLPHFIAQALKEGGYIHE